MASKLVAPTRKPIRLAAVRPNEGIAAAYRATLERMIAAMHADIVRTLTRAWREKPPEMAQDESPAAAFRDAMDKLRRRWEDGFEELADRQARKFAGATAEQADRAFKAQLRKAGFSVRFRMSREVNDVVQSAITENVALIRSIPAQYLTSVQSQVSAATQTGRDIGALTKALEQSYGVTHRRAAFIARDQVSKSTASVTRARQLELGITEALWLHSLGGKHPRPSHVKMNRQRYSIKDGVVLDGERVWPGTAVNCRCVSVSIVPGLD